MKARHTALLAISCLTIACGDDASGDNANANSSANSSANASANGSTANSSTENAATNTAGISQEPYDGDPFGTMTFTGNGDDYGYALYGAASALWTEDDTFQILALNAPPTTTGGSVSIVIGRGVTGPGTFQCGQDDNSKTTILYVETRDRDVPLQYRSDTCEVIVTAAGGPSEQFAGTFTATMTSPADETFEVTDGEFDLIVP